MSQTLCVKQSLIVKICNGSKIKKSFFFLIEKFASFLLVVNKNSIASNIQLSSFLDSETVAL
jgi:hypothetical protein